jgi:hypothetical protein
MAKESAPRGPVSRADIEAKLREIKGEVNETTEAAKPIALVVGVAAAVAVVAFAYVMGRRKGRKRTTVVEVRRV